MVEHGYLQKESIHHIFRQNGLHSIETFKDLAGLDRFTLAQIS
jgi:methylase of polypeptide subunit release factors